MGPSPPGAHSTESTNGALPAHRAARESKTPLEAEVGPSRKRPVVNQGGAGTIVGAQSGERISAGGTSGRAAATRGTGAGQVPKLPTPVATPHLATTDATVFLGSVRCYPWDGAGVC